MITPSFSLTATERVLPRLALDFTTASLDPRVTFTRTGNTATVVNSSGFVESINADLPRFDFDPVTLACKGLLIEESRANSIFPSNDFSGYILSNTAVVLTSGTSPDGTNNANKINELATTTTHFIRKDTTLGNAAYTVTIYAKAAERTAFGLQLADGVAGGAAWKFDLTNGVSTQDTGIAAGSWTSISGSITNAGNGWYRCRITATKGAGSAVSVRVHTLLSYAGSVVSSYLGVVGSGILSYGLQLETGAFATSYIPTEATAVTRNADQATMTGTNFSDWYNASEGTAYVESYGASLSSGISLIFTEATYNNNNRWVMQNTNAVSFFVSSNGSTSATFAFTLPTFSTTTYNKYASSIKVNNFVAVLNNSAPQISSSGATPLSIARLDIGYRSSNANWLNGWIKKINYYNIQLTNAELRAITK